MRGFAARAWFWKIFPNAIHDVTFRELFSKINRRISSAHVNQNPIHIQISIHRRKTLELAVLCPLITSELFFIEAHYKTQA